MEIGNSISHQDFNEAPGSFHDFAAHFSKAEWKLFHKWQRELYEIVMKEIQQALTSLAPRISNSIFSLRPKEKEDLFHTDLQDSEIKNKSDCSLRLAPVVPIPSFSDDDESEAYSMETKVSERGQASGCFTERAVNTSVVPFRIKEEKTSSFDDYLTSETQESIDSPTGHDSLQQIVSFVIKEDGTSDSMDHQDSESRESSDNPAGVQQLSSDVEEGPVASINCIQLRHPSLVFPHVISDGIMARLVIMRPGEERRNRIRKPSSSVADTEIIREDSVLHGTTQVNFHRSIVERTHEALRLTATWPEVAVGGGHDRTTALSWTGRRRHDRPLGRDGGTHLETEFAPVESPVTGRRAAQQSSREGMHTAAAQWIGAAWEDVALPRRPTVVTSSFSTQRPDNMGKVSLGEREYGFLRRGGAARWRKHWGPILCQCTGPRGVETAHSHHRDPERRTG
ncbi:hypothetical protein NDU88_006072 [Pleurodeles waltl]|uniref:KRAB domain-containing protein n=1 Tax=Pleurodeles waltl TaxID=8319 RepID=A0AAV7QKR1_PLEWA|nr:hypothetical protein NDU88_006072 [Pleurodeles waltl]